MIHQMGKESGLGDELLVDAILHNLSILYQKDSVTLLDCGKPVCNDDPCAFQGVERLGNFALLNIIQRACCLVEHHNAGLGGNGARYRQPLAPASGDTDTAFGQQCIQLIVDRKSLSSEFCVACMVRRVKRILSRFSDRCERGNGTGARNRSV